MVDERTWDEFRKSGLLWLINTILHVFGWAICIEYNNDNVRAFPARVKYRGFSEERNTDGYKKISDYIFENAESILSDCNSEENEI